jgi:hypothetical protein
MLSANAAVSFLPGEALTGFRDVNVLLYLITALTTARIWVLDRRVFQHIMMKTGIQRHEESLKFLRR